MAIQIQAYLKDNGLTIKEISRQSGISTSTLSTAFNKPVENWTVKIINAVAKSVHAKPSEVLNTLQDDDYKLEINNEEQTIQGIHIEDREKFQNIRFAVQNNYLEGWQPNRNDILYLNEEYDHPDPIIQAEYEAIFGEDNE